MTQLHSIEGADPILGFFNVEQARAVVAYRGDEALRARIEEFANKNTEDELTAAERAEYEGYVQANKFIAILQAKAKKLLRLGLAAWMPPRGITVRQARWTVVVNTADFTKTSRLWRLCTSSTSFLGKHGGTDQLDNLALACIDCNLHKGSNVAGYDPETKQLTELFHPRRHRWTDHFKWQGVLISGTTAIGRTTVEVLRMNIEERMQLSMFYTRER